MSYVVFTLKVTGTNASVHWKKMGVIQLAWLKQYSKTAPYTSFSLILVNMVIWRQFKSQIMLQQITCNEYYVSQGTLACADLLFFWILDPITLLHIYKTKYFSVEKKINNCEFV